MKLVVGVVVVPELLIVVVDVVEETELLIAATEPFTVITFMVVVSRKVDIFMNDG